MNHMDTVKFKQGYGKYNILYIATKRNQPVEYLWFFFCAIW